VSFVVDGSGVLVVVFKVNDSTCILGWVVGAKVCGRELEEVVTREQISGTENQIVRHY